MSEESLVQKLIEQCRSNDVDVKVDALTKLQVQFEQGASIPDVDGLIEVLKSCLRHSNQLLTTATLSVFPPLLPLLVSKPFQNADQPNQPFSPSSSTSSTATSALLDLATLRQLLNALLPPGGLFERLGDREKAQLKARETLVILGGMAFRAPSSSMRASTKAETPLMIYERYLRESGLASKVWKVREQSILALVHIRRKHHMFPLRPYLPLLVASLEDTDAHVRDTAKQSVIELFSGPGVADGARADLKKEMTKKGVRKAIVDGVLNQLMGAGALRSEGSENGDAAPQAYVPPSLALAGRKPSTASTPMSRSVSTKATPVAVQAPTPPPPATPTEGSSEVQSIYIASARDMENEFAAMAKPFEGKETEHNWADRERAVLRVRGMLKGEAHVRYEDTFLGSLKEGFIQWSLKTLASLRTTVCVNTCQLYCELAVALRHNLDPFCETILTNLLKMANMTKKLAAQQSQLAFSTVINHTSAQPRLVIPLLWQTLQEKSTQSRTYAISHINDYLKIHGPHSKMAIEASGGLEILEKAIRKALTDSNPAVKEASRATFWAFEVVWKDQGQAIFASLDATAARQLERACPNPEVVAKLQTTAVPAASKKSSVAAAIAATRAKAKAMAQAPPTLRHQAASTARGTSPPLKRAGSPLPSPPRNKSFSSSTSTVPRPSSPLSHSTSSPPRARLSPGGLSRSVSAGNYTTSLRRSASPPSSPTPRNASTTKRKVSSPLAPTVSRLSASQIAANIPLPVSPPARHVGNARPSLAFPAFPDFSGDDDLMRATAVPIPEDSDSEEMSISFSAVYEHGLPQAPSSPSKSQDLNFLSTPSNSGAETSSQPVVEDALRARAEQAESAAERLLELVEPDEEVGPTIPSSLLVSHKVPATPVSKTAAILKQAASFQNSPAHQPNGGLMGVIEDRKHETGWWLKRMALLDHGSPLREPNPGRELRGYISALESGEADVHALKKLALLSTENPVAQPSTNSFFGVSQPVPSDIWQQDKSFDRLFKALKEFSTKSQDEQEIEYALIVLWELLENQAPYFEGNEGYVFELLLEVRDCNFVNVLEATNTIRDALTARIDPVYGLTTMHAALRIFRAQPTTLEDIRASTCAFALIALGKFILRLPAEILEEELPRIKTTMITSLNDQSSLVVRESAAAALIAAQVVLRDETHLFALLDGLADEKKNLLTYLFDKHSVRGVLGQSNGMDKLERELARLDTKTSTPKRS